MHGRRLSLTLLALCAALIAPSAAHAADGDPDLSFGGDGQVFEQLEDVLDIATDPVVDQAPDGSLVAGVAARVIDERSAARGAGFEGIRIFRVSADGSDVDQIAFVPRGDPRLHALRVLADGRIVFVADDDGAVFLGSIEDGALDTVDLPQECLNPVAAAIGADGRPYVLDPCGVMGYTAGGDLDDDWSGNGFAQLTPAGFPGFLSHVGGSLRIAPDGKVLALVEHLEGVSARADADGGEVGAAVVRYTTAGDHDTSFDEDGVALLPGTPGALGVGPDGRPVATTGRQLGLELRGSVTDFLLHRLTTGGAPDDGFGDGGTVDASDLCCPRSAGLAVQKDHKVVVVAPPAFTQSRGGSVTRVVLRRYLENGEIDASFAEDGDQDFLSEGAEGPSDVGPPLLQADGKIVVPFAWTIGLFARAIDVAAPDGLSFGLARFGNPSLAPDEEDTNTGGGGGGGGQAQQQQQPAAAPVPGTTALTTASTRRCVSRRSFPIRLRTGRRKGERSAIVSVQVRVNGKRVRARRTGATVNLRNLPKGRFTVVIALRLADGGRVRDVRRYRTCAQKIERQLAPLRTRPPR